jgi:uncharacterized membrane protein
MKNKIDFNFMMYALILALILILFWLILFGGVQ